MMDSSKLRAVIFWTTLLMIAYAILLAYKQHSGTLGVGEPLFTLPSSLPFVFPAISQWWNLLVFTMIPVVIVLFEGGSDIAGERYSGKNYNQADKLTVRIQKHSAKMISLSLTLLFSCVLAFGAPFTEGRISLWTILAFAAFLYPMFYGVYAMATQMGLAILKENSYVYFWRDDRGDEMIYCSFVTKFVKEGIVTALPFIIGHTIGFLVMCQRLIFKDFQYRFSTRKFPKNDYR